MNLVIVGATGVVGNEVLHCLDELNIEVKNLELVASTRSEGKEIQTKWGDLVVVDIEKCDWDKFDFAIFCAGGETSEKYAPIAVKNGCRVIDNSSFFRYDESVPLVVPEINAESIGSAPIIANPNCTTAIAAVALWPIYQEFGLQKIIVSTYQSTSGAGAAGMAELKSNTQSALAGESLPARNFAHPIEFNTIPHIDKFQPNGYTKEEMKFAWETKKIFDDSDIAISSTSVRIPTLRAHGESITIQTAKPVSVEAVRELLATSPGVKLCDNPENNTYPMPLTASGKFDVEVGRIRQSLVFGDRGIDLFVCGDQLLKGAALNAVQILAKIK